MKKSKPDPLKKKWKKHGDVRLNSDGSIDEIVLKHCSVHLEQMDDNHYWMGLYAKDGSKHGICMHLRFAAKGRIRVSAETDDNIISEGFDHK